MVYDVSTAASPKIIQYINLRQFNAMRTDIKAGQAGDLDPEKFTVHSSKRLFKWLVFVGCR